MTLALTITAIATAALTWWFATGAILWLGRAASAWHGVATLSLAVPAVLSLMLVVTLRDEPTVVGAVAGFMAAVVIWAWHEAAFLFGQLLGPRREPCPDGVGRGRRFRLAFAALRDHEIALAATLALIVALSWQAANTVAAETFAVLWFCRLGAKLCIFEGVPAMAHGLMPARLAHLKSYFGDARPGVAFSLAVAAMTAALATLIARALAVDTAADLVGAVLLATLVALALIEHAFMVLPVSDERLWKWAVPHANAEGDDECAFGRAVVGRRLQGVALEARAVVPTRRAP